MIGLRLGPLPKNELVRLTIALPAAVKTDLDRYSELYARAYGEAVDTASLIPHMLATFMARDRAFRAARHSVMSAAESDSEPTAAARPSTSAVAAEGSSSG